MSHKSKLGVSIPEMWLYAKMHGYLPNPHRTGVTPFDQCSKALVDAGYPKASMTSKLHIKQHSEAIKEAISLKMTAVGIHDIKGLGNHLLYGKPPSM